MAISQLDPVADKPSGESTDLPGGSHKRGIMPRNPHHHQKQTAVEPTPADVPASEASHRFGAAEAAVIIVLVLTAATLAYTGMALLAILQLLLGASLIGAVTIAISHARSGKRLLKILRAVLGAAQ
ncbi:hypothetical protein [Streptomyces sp. NPDC090798]|uniref:hypothetical protein n=1 Tax=Streptomyces sp. NPDC090798 TaxID=3365968 RepID=UPI0038223D19